MSDTTMTTQANILQFFAQLNELADKLGALATTLEREQIALTQNTFADIEKLAQEKEILSGEIEQAEKRRRDLCVQLNIDCDFSSIKHYLSSVSATLANRLETQWDTIVELGHRCTSQNQVNGILVAHHQRHTQQALAILRGITGDGEVYSASGAQKQGQNTQHSLGHV